MKTILSSRRRQHLAIVCILLVTVTLIAGPAGCDGSVIRYDLTVSSTGAGSVTVPGEGVFTYGAERVVNLVASPDAGCHFVNWTGDVSTITDMNAPATTITMDGDYEVMANFEEGEPPDTLTVSVSIPSTQPWTDTGLNVSDGDEISITASGLVSWDYTGVQVGPDGRDDPGQGSCQYVVMDPNVPAQSLVGNIVSSPTVIFSDDFEYDDSIENHGWTIEHSNSSGDPQTATDPENPENRVAHMQSMTDEPGPNFYHSFCELPLEPGMEISIRFYDTGDSCGNCDAHTTMYFDDGTDYLQVGWYNDASNFEYSYNIDDSWSGHHYESYGLRGVGWHTFTWRVEEGGGIDVLIDGNLIVDDLTGVTTLLRFHVNGGSDPHTYSFSVDDFLATGPPPTVIFSDDFEYDDSIENHGWTIEHSNSSGDPQTATDPENPENRVAHMQSMTDEPGPNFYHSFCELPLEPGMEISIRFYDTGDSCGNCDAHTTMYFDDGTDYLQVGWYNDASNFEYSYNIDDSWSGHHYESYGLRGVGWHTFVWRVNQSGGIDVLIDGNLIVDDLTGVTTLLRFHVNGGSDPHTYSFSVDDFSLTRPLPTLDGKGFFVGSNFIGIVGTAPIDNVTSTSGKLFLGFNDGAVYCDRTGYDAWGFSGDNKGSFAVNITITFA